MKKMKKLSVLAAGSIAICLQLGTSLALAAEEVCVDGDTVTGIKNLEVVTVQYGVVNIDVDFRYETGYDAYGSELGNFPFDGIGAEEDVIETMLFINNALDATNPIPDYAGQTGQDVYFIGVEAETRGGAGVVLAIGSENATGEFWDLCTGLNDCLASAAVLKPGDRFTYADLSKANGNGCGNAPPDDFPITPGISGSWYDSTRNGEGFMFEVVGSELDPDFLVYFYTYDNSGNLMWVSGVGEIEGSTSIVEMFITSGTGFGDNFNPDDVVTEGWGTMTFTFSACREGTAEYVSDDFGSGSYNIERITSISGLSCP